MSSKSGTLWIVATPLGNPGDLSPRAREVLTLVDGVLAEDTRKTGQLFARCGISARALTSFHDHNEEDRLPQALHWLKEGKNLAVVSDAGTPLLADPGYRLVRACRKEGITVSPVPGPFAAATALCASGLAPYPFAFLGFTPRKASERVNFFAPYARLPLTLIFFERKDRLRETLDTAHTVLGEREVCIARELTKTHEEFIFFSLGEACEKAGELLGEITVLIGPPIQGQSISEAEIDRILLEEAAEGGKPKEMARRAGLRLSATYGVKNIPGWSGKDMYARLQDLLHQQHSAPGGHGDGPACDEAGSETCDKADEKACNKADNAMRAKEGKVPDA